MARFINNLNNVNVSSSSKSTVASNKKMVSPTTNTSATVKPANNTSTVIDAVSTPEVDMSKLVDDKRKLLDLKTNIENIIRYLNETIESLETPSSRIKDLYNIDSASIDCGRINVIRQDLINRKNYLNNVVLIELDQNIKKINESMG